MPNSNFPGQVDDFTALIVSEVQADLKNKSDHVRKALAGVTAIEQTLGVNPQGGSGTVGERVAAVEAAVTSTQTAVTTVQSEVTSAQAAITALASSEASDVAVLQAGKVAKSGDTMTGTLVTPALTVGSRSGSLGTFSVAEGNNPEASGFGSHAEGNATHASGTFAHAEGSTTTASQFASHAEGNNSQAMGSYSHAEGDTNKAMGSGSHAEGGANVAGGSNSHAEGFNNYALQSDAHVEGYANKAIGAESHAEGNSNVATGNYSHAEGQGVQAGAAVFDFTLTSSTSTIAIVAGDITAALAGATVLKFFLLNALASQGDYIGVVQAINSVTFDGVNTLIDFGPGQLGNSTAGSLCRVDKISAHAEGTSTVASGANSHSGGLSSEARADNSFAHGKKAVVQMNHDGSAVLADGQNFQTLSDSGDQLKVRYLNGLKLVAGGGADGVDGPEIAISQASVGTTDATPTALQTIAVPTDSVVMLKAKVLGRRTGGSSGSGGDSACYELWVRAKNIGGVVTIHDAGTFDFVSEDQPAWDAAFAVSGTNVLVNVTGAADNNITWHTSTVVQRLF